MDLSKGGADLGHSIYDKSKLRELHMNFVQRHLLTLLALALSPHSAAVGETLRTHAHLFLSRLLLAARRTLSAG